jgi:intracellular sulfur oxidation DsrE/DsrF family protein
MTNDKMQRRGLLAAFGGAVGALVVGTRRVAAQATSAFQPARHDQDAWLDKMPGKHRIVLDVTSPGGVPDAIRFAGNIFEGSKTAYGLEDKDIAMVIVLRHSATGFGYSDAIWAKHGAMLGGAPAAGAEAPKGNPQNAPPRNALDALAKRGVQFMVCGTASRGISRRIAGQGGDAEAVYKEMVGSMIPSSRIVAAGVIGVTRAQEYGFNVIHAG